VEVDGMAAEHKVKIGAGAQGVHSFLRDGMSHVALISEDVFGSELDGDYVAVLLYEQYFMRVSNQAALMLVISGDGQSCAVKSVACAASGDLLLQFDLGAAGDFAAEPLQLLRDKYGRRVESVF